MTRRRSAPDLTIARIGQIARLMDDTILVFLKRTGETATPELTRAYLSHRRELEALREALLFAPDAGVSVTDIRAAVASGYTFTMLRDALRAHAERQRQDALTAVKHRSDMNREAAVQRGRNRQTKARALDVQIAQAHRDYRARHPYSREHSTRALALRLATQLHQPAETIRYRLRALKLR